MAKGRFLSDEGMALLHRARAGYEAGKVDRGLLRDIEMVLLDSCEWHNKQIDIELKKVGA